MQKRPVRPPRMDSVPVTCRHCGYDVRGLPTSFCPECGRHLAVVGTHVHHPAQRQHLHRTLTRLARWAAMVLIGVICAVASFWGVDEGVARLSYTDAEIVQVYRMTLGAGSQPQTSKPIQRPVLSRIDYLAGGASRFWPGWGDSWKQGVPTRVLRVQMSVFQAQAQNLSPRRNLSLELQTTQYGDVFLEGKHIGYEVLLQRFQTFGEQQPRLSEDDLEAAAEHLWSLATGQTRLLSAQDPPAPQGWKLIRLDERAARQASISDLAEVAPLVAGLLTVLLCWLVPRRVVGWGESRLRQWRRRRAEEDSPPLVRS